VSKQRQRARAERERQAAQRAAAARTEQQRLVAVRQRRDRRALAWRRARIWQHGAGFRRNRERWGAFATLVLACLLLAYLTTRSWTAVVCAALVLLVGAPVLALLFFDRRSR